MGFTIYEPSATHVLMTKEEMKQRTKAFGLRVIKLFRALPASEEARIIGRQLLRSGISVGANYRSACRAKSTADFINKLMIVEEEADESLFWMELLVEGQLMSEQQVGPLMQEGDELVAIVVAAIKTSRQGQTS